VTGRGEKKGGERKQGDFSPPLGKTNPPPERSGTVEAAAAAAAVAAAW